MKSVTLSLRKAYVLALNNIVYKNKVIPVYEEYVQPTATRPVAILTNGNMDVEAYIILLNQTSNDDSSKCIRNDQSSIQIQITTVFPANKGGSLMAEEISELVMAELFTEDGLFNTLELPEPFGLWKGEMVSAINLNYNTDTSRIWITQIVLNNHVNQR